MKPTSRSFLSIRGFVLLAMLALAAVLAPQMPPVTAAPTLPAASSQSVGVNTNGVIVSPTNFITTNQIVTVPYAATNFASAAAGYTTLTAPASNSTNTIAVAGLSSASESITLPAGTGAYTNSVVIQDTGATTNKTVEVNVAWPTSTNATLAVYDNAVSGSPILTPKTSTAQGGNSTFEFHWTGSGWKEFPKGEVPSRVIPATTYAAMQNALDGAGGLASRNAVAETQAQAQNMILSPTPASTSLLFGLNVATDLQYAVGGANGLWALNSSGNFPSFTLDPSATFTIPSGGTLVMNGTLNVSKLDQKTFSTTTLEQAYVLDSGQLALAQDTGLVYIGDGSAGGHLVNMSALPTTATTGSALSLTYSGQASTATGGVAGGAAYFQGGSGAGYGGSATAGGSSYLTGGPGVGGFTWGGNAYVRGGASSGGSPGAVYLGDVNTSEVYVGTANGTSASATVSIFTTFFFDQPTTVPSTVTMQPGGSYVANRSSRCVLNLPTTAAVGAHVAVYGLGSGGWQIAQPASVQVVMSGSATTVGTSGYVNSANQYDSIVLVCIVANATWEVIGGHGAYTFN